MNKLFLIVFTNMLFQFIISCAVSESPFNYAGVPYTDKIYTKGIQTIPGKIQCEYYDLGGEGIAFHDSDSINSGSGNLNPLNGSAFNEFRMNESVDISYTKSGGVDDNPFNLVKPEMNKLYVGWTEPGEWLNYTVDVQQAGEYQIGLMYTSNRGGRIALAVNGKDITGPSEIFSTYNSADSIAWRQWHHWNYQQKLAKVELKKGQQILTLKTVSEGMMNYDYLNFELIDNSKN